MAEEKQKPKSEKEERAEMGKLPNVATAVLDEAQHYDRIAQIRIKSAAGGTLTKGEEEELKQAYCDFMGYPKIAAQFLYIIYGNVAEYTKLLLNRVKKAIPTLVIETDCYTDEKVIMRANRNPADSENKWIPVKWDKEKASHLKKGKRTLWDSWDGDNYNPPQNKANMLKNRAVSELLDAIAPAEKAGVYTKDELEEDLANYNLSKEENIECDEIVSGEKASTNEEWLKAEHAKKHPNPPKKLANYDPDAELK